MTHQSTFVLVMVQNITGKGENTAKYRSFVLPQCFLSYLGNFTFQVIFILLFCYCFFTNKVDNKETIEQLPCRNGVMGQDLNLERPYKKANTIISCQVLYLIMMKPCIKEQSPVTLLLNSSFIDDLKP